MVDSNTQTQPANPASTGPTVEELQAQLEVTRKESEGRLRDLQSERTRRQELETRVPLAPPPEAPTDVTQDELGKVINPYIAPVVKEVAAVRQFIKESHQEKALEFLAAKTGKSKEAIMADKDLQDRLVAVANKWRFVGNVYDVTQRAYEAMGLEDMRTKEADRQRAVKAAADAGLPPGTPPPPATSSKEYSVEDFNALPLLDYDKLQQNGTFHQNEAGKIVYTVKK